MFSEIEPTGHGSEPETPARAARDEDEEPQEQSMWDAYWERFRRQEVDDPVEQRREGFWERFQRQQVDDPVDRRKPRPSS
jgi:hypothetical protein